jgi:hypothetical protein
MRNLPSATRFTQRAPGSYGAVGPLSPFLKVGDGGRNLENLCGRRTQSVAPPGRRIIRPALAALSLHVMPQIEAELLRRPQLSFRCLISSAH